MATILLQAAGSLLGGLVGPIGAAVGSAAGAMLGYTLDRSLLNSLRHEEGPRLSGQQPFTAEDGAPLPRVYGTMRVSGTMIWATRFEEDSRTERRGAKGGPRQTTYSYYANVAIALCEGEIAGVRRIWADGKELDLDGVEFRVHRGSAAQAPDPLILAKQGEGNAPAYRGTAYVVFERLPLEQFGNRIPQLNFEVMRPVGRLTSQIRAVALIPGSTEYGLHPEPVTRLLSAGESVSANRHVLHARSDIVASLDELQALCPDIEHIGLVVTWFGDDLRIGTCSVRPKVVDSDESGYAAQWRVAGLERSAAEEVSTASGGPAYGGTPSDESVVAAIREIKDRGLQVTLYPFIMMDVPAENTLPDPSSDAVAQPAYPWRGRITCIPGPGRSDSADKTSAARLQVEQFCGATAAADYAVIEDSVSYFGDADEWSYRRFILHYAALAAAAGGVDAFLIGSEMRGATTLRDQDDRFPFVEQLCGLAQESRALLGVETKISYAADWSEFFGHQPSDGSGDVFFHLDPLWAHDDIDAIGIDFYIPLADWRDEDHFAENPDGAIGPDDCAALREAIHSCEGFDWYYASDEDRRARARTPISDAAYDKPWVYRYKDLVAWWENLHYDRPSGTEASAPTPWIPRGKPFWLTEVGCAAVDRGANQPNVFPDPKSSEDALPYFSSGGRSDSAQHNLLLAHHDHWNPASVFFDPARNPVSPVYAGRMVDHTRLYCWAWDARPFPAFPLQRDTWADGENWIRGHWLNGRLSGVELADLVTVLSSEHGVGDVSCRGVSGHIDGYIVAQPSKARDALEPLAALFGLSISTVDGRMTVSMQDLAARAPIPVADCAIMSDVPMYRRVRAPDRELASEATLSFVDPLRVYQNATTRVSPPIASRGEQEAISIPAALDAGLAQALMADWARRRWIAREQVEFATAATRLDLEPGAVVSLAGLGSDGAYLITALDQGLARTFTARQIVPALPSVWQSVLPHLPGPVAPSGQPFVVTMDLPLAGEGVAAEDRFLAAARLAPWRTLSVYASPEETGFDQRTTLTRPATIGFLRAPLQPGFEGRRDFGAGIEVELLQGELESVSDAQLLHGANIAAVQCTSGEWEVLQFQQAAEVAPSLWRLGALLRGDAGTELAMRRGAAEGACFVLLDSAVRPAGLRSGEAGLPLWWSVGSAGSVFAGSRFARFQAAGGMRAARPLPPAQLRVQPEVAGGLAVSWQRRSQRATGRGISGTAALDQPVEAYRVTIAAAGAEPVRTTDVTEPAWFYDGAAAMVDFPSRPVAVEISVAQLSLGGGPGDETRTTFLMA